MAYAVVADIRSAGLTDTAAYPDGQVQAALDVAGQFIDRTTRQWFESRSLTLLLDGNDSQLLPLGVPIITLTKLFINGNFNDPTDLVATTDYTVYNRVYPDDRRNPRVKLNSSNRSIFIPPSLSPRGRLFIKGFQNQKLVGTFGFVEGDGSCPLLIKKAMIKLALKWVSLLAPYGIPPGSQMIRAGETTDGHSVQYAMPPGLGSKLNTLLITQDPEVDQILLQYRAPIAMAVPGSSNMEAG